MKRTLILVLLVFSGIHLFAQTATDTTNIKKWNFSGSTGLNFSQTSLSNWSAGGDNSIAGNAILNATGEYKSGPWLWQNNLIMEYGLTSTKADGMKKSTDRLEFSTQLGYTTNNKWYYTGMIDFKTQFYKGYNYPDKSQYISKFMAPGYLNISLGIEYKPENQFYSIYYSPLAAKLTFVEDDRLSEEGAFGVDKGDKSKTEIGSYLKLKAQKDIMENVKLITDANFFTPYDKSFGQIDVEWNLLLSMKINKYLNASLNTTLKYDNDVKYINKEGNPEGARVQFKEIIGIGIGYNF